MYTNFLGLTLFIISLLFRERTVDKELEEENGSKEPSPTPEQVPEKEVVKMPPTEIPIMTNMERKQTNDYWPRKMRSDITRSRVI